MDDGNSVTKHLNFFNTLVSQLVFVDINIVSIKKRLGKDGMKGEKYDLTLPLRFGVVECLWRRQHKKVVG